MGVVDMQLYRDKRNALDAKDLDIRYRAKDAEWLAAQWAKGNKPVSGYVKVMTARRPRGVR